MDSIELRSLLADAVQIGYMEAIRVLQPANDELRASEVKAWLKLLKIDWPKFRKLEAAGLIKAYRKGSGNNSPLYYSKSQIKQALTTAKIAALQ